MKQVLYIILPFCYNITDKHVELVPQTLLFNVFSLLVLGQFKCRYGIGSVHLLHRSSNLRQFHAWYLYCRVTRTEGEFLLFDLYKAFDQIESSPKSDFLQSFWINFTFQSMAQILSEQFESVMIYIYIYICVFIRLHRFYRFQDIIAIRRTSSLRQINVTF